MNNNEIQDQYFKEVISFLKETQWLYNTPVTKILIKGSLDLFPAHWVDTLKKLKNNELNYFVATGNVQIDWPISLIEFVNKCNKFNRLLNPKISLSPIQLPQIFMKKVNLKKQHEIFHLAHLIHKYCAVQNISLIVDLGAGLGYICQLLNYFYGYKVLGIESKPQNVQAARIRQKTFFPDSLPSVKYVCRNISIDSSREIESIIKHEFKSSDNICLMGLHACGDLSIFMSKIYLEMSVAQLLIFVSCCYHKLTLAKTEKRNEDTHEKEYFNYFPLSSTLKNAFDDSNIDVGELFRRPFMRLACQETSDRWLTMLEEVHNQHSFYVLGRAVLELYGDQNELHLEKLVRKGTRKSQCSNFENYLKDCMQRYKYEKKTKYNEVLSSCSIPWSDKIKNEIIHLWNNNIEKQKKIELYTALQLLLQHVAESLILFDRVCFLKEHNYEANIVPVMDRSLSPRCYAIVSNKDGFLN